MTDRIDELQRLHEAATQGPWDVLGAGGILMDGTRDGGYQLLHGTMRVARTGIGPGIGPAQQRDDMHLIAAMRNTLPALLRVARAAERCLDGSEVDGWHTPMREVDVIELRAALDELERPADE